MSANEVTQIRVGKHTSGIIGLKAVGSVPPKNKLKEWLLEAA